MSTSAAERVGSAGGRAEVGSIGRSGGIEERRNGGAGRRHRHAVRPAGGGGHCGRVGGAGAGSEEQQHEHHGQGVEVEGLAVAQLDGNHRGAIEAEGAGLKIGREQRSRGAVAGRRVGLPVDGRGGIDGGRRRGGRRGVRVLVGREEALTEAAPEVDAEADDEGEFEEVEHEHEGFAEQVVELLEEVEHGVWSDEGVKRGGDGWICGFAVGARRFAWRVVWCGVGGWALPCGRWRSGLVGWASVAALWVCFDGAKVRFCSKENRFFGILHDEKAADCGGVLQACGREPRASASLQPGALRPRPDGGASLGAGGAPLPAVPPLTRTEPDHVRRRVGLGGGAAARGASVAIEEVGVLEGAAEGAPVGQRGHDAEALLWREGGELAVDFEFRFDPHELFGRHFVEAASGLSVVFSVARAEIGFEVGVGEGAAVGDVSGCAVGFEQFGAQRGDVHQQGVEAVGAAMQGACFAAQAGLANVGQRVGGRDVALRGEELAGRVEAVGRRCGRGRGGRQCGEEEEIGFAAGIVRPIAENEVGLEVGIDAVGARRPADVVGELQARSVGGRIAGGPVVRVGLLVVASREEGEHAQEKKGGAHGVNE